MAIQPSAFASAVSAYNRAAKGPGAGGMEPRDGGGDFASLVKGAMQGVRDMGQTAERASLAAVVGRADLSAVTTAVAEAELALQTVVAVRDRVIEAYKEIMRMPV
jgi:flagellar hook-basal body complex protein FliE